MKINKLTSAVLLSASVLALASCNDDNDDKEDEAAVVLGCGNVDVATPLSQKLNDKKVCRLSGQISENTTLSSDYVWALSGPVFVGNDNKIAEGTKDTVLTIEAGTTIVAVEGPDALVIQRDGQIEAVGTAQKPIVFTHWDDLSMGDAFVEGKGKWGGLVINGYGKSNQGSNVAGEGFSGYYGGDNNEDSSGTLKYVVIKYSGYKFGDENEFNGIAFQAVGSGTTIDYVQAHMSSDDGVEFFGGAVNAKHLVLTGNDDDSLDATHGFQGKLQYVYIEQDSNGDRGLEINSEEDADAMPSETSMPQTTLMIANMTVIAKSTNKDSDAVKFRGRAQATLINTYITSNDTKKDCIEAGNTAVDGDDSGKQPDSASVTLMSVVASACTSNMTKGNVVNAADVVTGTTLNATWSGHEVIVSGVTAVDASATDAFFDNTNYIGAMDSTDWTAGWTVGL